MSSSSSNSGGLGARQRLSWQLEIRKLCNTNLVLRDIHHELDICKIVWERESVCNKL